MRLLFYQWEGFMQRDTEAALKKMGISYVVCKFPFKEKNDPEELKVKIKSELSQGNYDGIISLNYRDQIAECANEANIPYIAWVYDSPFGVTQDDDTLNLPTNHIFVFDRRDYRSLRDRGIETVYHMDLAVNVDRLDRLVLSTADHKRFDANISFIGSLYTSSFTGFRSRIDDDQAAYVEDVIAKQSVVQGKYMLDDLTSDEAMLESLQRRLEGEYRGYDRLFHEGLQSILAKEITRRDRLMLLMFFAEVYDGVALYSNSSDPLLQKVDERGLVESYEELFKVYKASKINLNITFRRIASGIPLRAIEVMGAGGFLLSNRQDELVERFTPGVDCEVYESIEEAAEKVAYYLTHDDEREKIAAHGRESAGKYTYEAQLGKIFDITFGEKYKGSQRILGA